MDKDSKPRQAETHKGDERENPPQERLKLIRQQSAKRQEEHRRKVHQKR